MADIVLSDVSKSYGQVQVLDSVSMHIKSGEFIVFLGPSGCGKSTLLRMIAGLEEVNGGQIHIGDTRVDQLPPNQRGVAMVFQNYALYPHMTVRENMSFGLQNVGTDKAEIARRVEDAARMLEIGALLERRPSQLSGGQRQRVAIGRAIVREPRAFLLDEPLSNLDASLRVRTRVELAQLHQRIGTTMVFVTHDQTEAMTLASRIVVMNNRRIEQIGTPMEVYSRPASRFVAAFVGSPAMNFLPVSSIAESDGQAVVNAGGVSIATEIPIANLPSGDGLTLGVRPDALKVTAGGSISGVVEIMERLGDRTLVHVRLPDGSLVVAEDGGKSALEPGATVSLAAARSEMHIFDAEGIAYHSS
ncbi:MAG: sn-glycerol-3-phosphate ABC transporter ATP-binding protein UgpC [Alphaproteobacteria bacterium]|nr:sn-glycerol-3-phosphate ABC transporter ATP-binding protein UgpC [Alphaproteobacteria bacterium]MBU1559314.1 sn-glycerol-3-phosphate ABC transporter ATP-binding protein UgpC [Alphaproteobacteria bacterium]MBU2304655.1 sn-glycerol-3-phosphate ABC transporter ATP-binding protein UgpC [Alphaproteobacteria bacterium]MBU2369958.1 sn-glycerol-3-phosphate ABC transporter ATP-binding protein UgpC [Alphaproteobacteria bacterium]